eukprot:g5142.t1
MERTAHKKERRVRINPEAEDVASVHSQESRGAGAGAKARPTATATATARKGGRRKQLGPKEDISEDPRFTKYFRLLKSGTPRTSVEILLKSKFPEVDISILDGWKKKKLFKPAPKPTKLRTRRSPRKRTKQSALRTYLRQKDDLQNLDKGVANAHNLLEEQRLTAVVTLVVRYIFVLLKATRSKTKNVFQQFDTSGDGELSLDEFSAGLVALGFVLKPDETERLFRTVDEDDSGNVTMPEFMEMIDRPIENVKLNIVEFRDALRRLEVVVDQDHSAAMFDRVVENSGGITGATAQGTSTSHLVDPAELHELLRNPAAVEELRPNSSLHGVQHDKNGLPPAPVRTFRFSNPLLSRTYEMEKEAKAAKDRALLIRTIKRLENNLINSAFRLWAVNTVKASYHIGRRVKTSALGAGQSKEEVSKDERPRLEDTLEDIDENASTELDVFAAQRARKSAKKQKQKKLEVRKKAVQKMKSHVQTLDRPDWNSSYLWPHRFSEFPEDQVPPLARLFKPSTYWGVACNPKPRQKPKKQQQHAIGGGGGGGRGARRRGVPSPRVRRGRLQTVEQSIAAFESSVSKTSPEFRRHLREVDPTPIPWGKFDYQPPMPIREYPMLEKTIREKGDSMLRKFRRKR